MKQLFEAAVDRDPEDRPAFLAQACGDDDEVIQEIESLLAVHEGDSTFMNTPAANLLVGDKPILAVGQRFGPYQEISPLGDSLLCTKPTTSGTGPM